MIAAAILALVIFLSIRILAGKYAGTTASNLAAFVAAIVFIGGILASPILGVHNVFAPSQVATANIAAAGPPIDVTVKCRHRAALRNDGFGDLDGLSVDATHEVVSDKTVLAHDVVLLATGWAADDRKDRPASAVCLVIDGAIFPSARSVIGSTRPDVVLAAKEPGLMKSGFTIWFAPKGLTSGRHTVQAAALSMDGTFAVSNEHIIRVK